MAKTEKNKEIIKLRSLKKRFGVGDAENFALNGVDLSVKKGGFIIIRSYSLPLKSMKSLATTS